jgi:hypothetical protein
MTPRQPRLDWIREVLADLAADDGRAPASFGTIERREPASANAHATDAPLVELTGEDRLLCPSWQLIRLAVMRNS